MRAIQRTQFCAKNVKNDLNPTNLVKHNFCFEMEGVSRVSSTSTLWAPKNLNLVVALIS